MMAQNTGEIYTANNKPSKAFYDYAMGVIREKYRGWIKENQIKTSSKLSSLVRKVRDFFGKEF